MPVAAPPNTGQNAHIVLLACFSVYPGGQGYQAWRGVLVDVSNCPYGVYVPSWTYGNSIVETRVFLTK